jgi:hypothetical protein
MPLASTLAGASSKAFGWTSGISLDGTYELIETKTISSAVATTVFTGIPTAYKHLHLMFSANTTGANNTNLYLQLNSVTSGYKRYWLQTNFATAEGSGDGANTSFLFGLTPGNSDNLVMSDISMWIHDYQNDQKNKTIHTTIASARSASPYGGWNGWMGAKTDCRAAVTSITIGSSSGNIKAGSMISLYGVRG